MKKLFTTTEYKKWNLRHAKKSLLLRIRRNKKDYIGGFISPQDEESYRRELRRKYPDYELVESPELFSFIENTEDVVKFIDRLMACYEKRQKVFVMLHNVKRINYDAIVVLLSIMTKFKEGNISFNGDKPSNRLLRELLDKSSFFNQLFKKKFEPSDNYEFTHHSNLICTHGEKNVAPDLSAKLIESAAKFLSGNQINRAQGVQRLMVELMQNTNNHASETQGEKHWWLSVNRDDRNRTVHFSFVDFGVGILSSLERKPDDSLKKQFYNKIIKRIGLEGQEKHLKEIFSGGLYSETVTGDYFRGKGLPGIGAVVRRGQISSLHIITNRVKGNVRDNTYEKLSCNFSGTFYHWELKMECLYSYGKTTL